MTLQELFNSPQKWTKETFAKDETGREVFSRRETAVCWCIKGGMQRCGLNDYDHENEDSEYIKIVRAIKQLFPDRQTNPANINQICTIAAFNDHPLTSFDDVRKVIELANV